MLHLLLACAGSSDDPAITPAADRAVGEQVPLATGCDPVDDARCWLPWPSFAYTRADATAETGLRVEIPEAELPVEDDPGWLELADGFSRISPVLTVVDAELATADGALRLFDAATGAEIPAWTETIVEGPETLVIAYPTRILPAASEIVAVVVGVAAEREHLDAVGLGLAAPETQAEEDLRGWYAPLRATIAAAGLAPDDVYRAWSFPTRSAADPGRRALSMLADVDATELSVTIEEVLPGGSDTIAAVVYGTVDGVPDFRKDREEWLQIGADGRPEIVSTHSAPFRVVVPTGEGDYQIALYGHGTGGDVTDDLFDAQIAGAGLGKVGMQFHGWNGDELIGSVAYFNHVFDASTRASSALLQSVADGHAILRALQGPLADALAAETLGGATNPAAGRRPIADRPIWVGGSLSGTMGAVIVAANEDIDTAVLNVPGGAWTHFIPTASLYTILVDPITRAWYPTDIDRRAALAMSQNAWDDVDGAAWDDPGSVLLLQESIDDPILPNVGTTMLARARGAVLVGAPIDDRLDDVEVTDGVVGRTAITQYYTPFTGDYDIHGFAAESGPVAEAAQQQIGVFLTDWRDGQEPRIILPDGCVERGGVCDFRE